MKRSEMLRIIWESINEVENAETLLTKLEEIGMLPPCTHKPHGCTDGCGMNEWEQEDVETDEATDKNWRERYAQYGEEE